MPDGYKVKMKKASTPSTMGTTAKDVNNALKAGKRRIKTYAASDEGRKSMGRSRTLKKRRRKATIENNKRRDQEIKRANSMQ